MDAFPAMKHSIRKLQPLRKVCIADRNIGQFFLNNLVLYSVLFRFGHIRRWDQCAVCILYSKISTDPGLLKIRHSHLFVAVVIQFLIPLIKKLISWRGNSALNFARIAKRWIRYRFSIQVFPWIPQPCLQTKETPFYRLRSVWMLKDSNIPHVHFPHFQESQFHAEYLAKVTNQGTRILWAMRFWFEFKEISMTNGAIFSTENFRKRGQPWDV